MSDVIQLLPDSVANQIAAGEVIQRPASVIKELVENSIDAGAKTIKVLVVDAGRTSVQVIDDGKGMSETDARLSFERHATSKISKADDLFALHTMGFRGEALASIAAVAQVELTTRMADNEIGIHLSLSASKVVGQEPVSCPVGSNFIVENLFFNVPARRKFLKTNATELNNIMSAYERIVLVYPDISFSIHSNGTEMMNLRAGSLRQRITDVFGKRLNQDLLPLDVDTALCHIHGFVGKPESAKKKGVHQYFFVNGRYMKHPLFHKAVMSSFERMVPMGMQVPYFIYFDVNPADIDVNIHPTKTEIKFENEHAIWQILLAAVKDAIGKFCEIPSIDFDTEGRPEIPIFDPTANIAPPKTIFNPEYNPFNSSSPAHKPKVPKDWERLYDGLQDQPSQEGQRQADMFDTDNPPTGMEGDNSIIEGKSPTHYQYKGRYIMTAVKSGLMIIDQHRAHVRVLFEQFSDRIRQHKATSEALMFPETIEFSAGEQSHLPQLMPQLEAMGFDLAPLGGGTYSVNSVPSGLGKLAVTKLIHDALATMAEDGTADMAAIGRRLALSLARSAAVGYGEVMTNNEMDALINALFSCSNTNYTPDGQTIMCILKQGDIEHLLR